MEHASLEKMPPPLKEAYLDANPDPQGLRAMFDRDRVRMLEFKDFSDSEINRIQARALVISGDTDVVLPEHALALSRALPHARLVIVPGGHGEYIGEICAPAKESKIPGAVTALIEEFLK